MHTLVAICLLAATASGPSVHTANIAAPPVTKPALVEIPKPPSGLALYNDQRFREAAELFAEANRAAPNGFDPPAAMYADRCRELAQSPPGPSWDRVYVMKHK